MRTRQELEILQNLPLEIKVSMTYRRLHEWIDYFGADNCYVSFSGGKDSTVLLHMARDISPDIKAVFVDTGLEYPEIREFVREFENVMILKPSMAFTDVVAKYGYPMIGKEVADKVNSARRGLEWALKFVEGRAKDREGKPSIYNIEKYKPLLHTDFIIGSSCCKIMKKAPVHNLEKKGAIPITAQMAEESRLRTQKWLKSG